VIGIGLLLFYLCDGVFWGFGVLGGLNCLKYLDW